ncbi:sperm-associated antigen 8 isoform X2 [Chrysemys picta bellii]|uniref:sperm-associated antigen 8 isoform X2 n=2 Tax=Chrysemys picta bellii TaxID=8478 RepID=UPI0032B1706F
MRPPRAGPHGVYCLHGDSKADCAGAEVIGRPEMERERPREDGTPQGSALTEQALLHSQGELPGSNGETPFNVAEMSPCHRERSPCMAETPGEMPPSNAEMEPCLVEMPPCHGEPGGSLGELLPCVVEMLPSKAEMPEEQPRLVSRGKCLVHNWQEERATNELDQVPSPELGSEGFFYRHGHHGLLTLQLLSQLVDSTTMKDSYRRPRRTGLPVRGQREAMLELMLYQKYRKETLTELYPPAGPMESLSTTHRHYCKEGFQPVLPPPSRPHDYRLEQPHTFWLESARQLPGVSNIRTSDTPFRRNATFTTPISEYLDQPLPYAPENYPKL